MGPPTHRTQKWVKNGPITMEFDETGKKFVQIYGSWSIFGVPRPPGAIPGRNGISSRILDPGQSTGISYTPTLKSRSNATRAPVVIYFHRSRRLGLFQGPRGGESTGNGK